MHGRVVAEARRVRSGADHLRAGSDMRVNDETVEEMISGSAWGGMEWKGYMGRGCVLLKEGTRCSRESMDLSCHGKPTYPSEAC
jgi:hypothetical protein